MQGYQVMPTEELLVFRQVALKTPVGETASRAGVRVSCEICGEEVINEREVLRDGMTLFRTCAGSGYYQDIEPIRLGAPRDLNMLLCGAR